MPGTYSIPPTPSAQIAVSIVVYRPDRDWLDTTLLSLRGALAHAHAEGVISRADVMLVDNDMALADRSIPADSIYNPALKKWLGLEQVWLRATVMTGHGNVGYGRGNNLAIQACSQADFHLVLNPDVTLSAEAITAALRYLKTHSECAMVTPVATAENGMPLYLVKAYPSVLTLALRGFAPSFIRDFFARRLNAYDRAELAFDAPITDAKIVSGCFMLIRRTALEAAGGFDPDFFLYFEDFDLSYRISQFGQLGQISHALAIHRVPGCRIVHGGGQAARKGFRHISLFCRSAMRFFQKHGWRIV